MSLQTNRDLVDAHYIPVPQYSSLQHGSDGNSGEPQTRAPARDGGARDSLQVEGDVACGLETLLETVS